MYLGNVRKREWLLLLGLGLVTSVAYAPKMLVNKLGLGYKKKFELEDLVIERPKELSSREHKKAFEDVGNYVTNFLTRDVMLAYEDNSLRGKSFLRAKNVSQDAWHDVLEYFRDEGVIEQRWSLKMHTIYGDGSVSHFKSSPRHDQYGRSFDKENSGKSTLLGGFQPDENTYAPSLLTDEQMRSLIGVNYAMETQEHLEYRYDRRISGLKHNRSRNIGQIASIKHDYEELKQESEKLGDEEEIRYQKRIGNLEKRNSEIEDEIVGLEEEKETAQIQTYEIFESDFERVFYRNREKLTQESVDQGIDKFRTVLEVGVKTGAIATYSEKEGEDN
jgi:hypothetical protein